MSHLNVFAISRYEPQICIARMIAVATTVSGPAGSPVNRFAPAAIAPRSAPTLIVLATSSPATTG